MPYPRETLQELSRRLETELPLAKTSDVLRRALYLPQARALAGAVHGLHDHLDWRTRQMFPQTCDDDVLENLHANLWLANGGRKQSAPAQGKIKVTGAAGSVIAQAALFNRNDNVQFLAVTGATIPAGGSIDVDVIALEPGAAGNTEANTSLKLVNPIAGVETNAKVIQLSGGADIENVEDLRGRVVESRQKGRDVGRAVDWSAWSKEVPGVTRVWPVPKLAGLGTITIYFVRDGDANIFPDDVEQEKLEAYLDKTGLPFGEVFCTAPVRKILNPIIQIKPDTPANRAACENALRTLINQSASPVQYDEDGYMPQPPTGVTIPKTHFSEAISTSPGEYDHYLQYPDTDVTCEVGDLLELGDITWL